MTTRKGIYQCKVCKHIFKYHITGEPAPEICPRCKNKS